MHGMMHFTRYFKLSSFCDSYARYRTAMRVAKEDQKSHVLLEIQARVWRAPLHIYNSSAYAKRVRKRMSRTY